jgi:hypothetical protein
MSAMGQTEKHSARADVFRSSSKNGRWFRRPKTLRGSQVGIIDHRPDAPKHKSAISRSIMMALAGQRRTLFPSGHPTRIPEETIDRGCGLIERNDFAIGEMVAVWHVIAKRTDASLAAE